MTDTTYLDRRAPRTVWLKHRMGTEYRDWLRSVSRGRRGGMTGVIDEALRTWALVQGIEAPPTR